MSARDRRFDGRFFTAVKTTGIYCRPICPATTPKRQNVMFYPTAAAAGEAGYRPCLRCRPEDAGHWRLAGIIQYGQPGAGSHRGWRPRRKR
ncbi:Ada metal-binding domain-containing protein [Rhizobium sophorae]|uniref:Ada metal-binding domain-containing protein n=1 Tax=Rhizobium sophorae TaxID=1535242 RepID=UPI0028A692A2|nr:Ada metal-binding domain-containing protein [Rhizobium sophorae]